MKRVLFFLSALFLFGSYFYAQQPQIARVNNDGSTTTIYTDLKKAISEAQDNDIIYLPGGTFNCDSVSFKNRINIIGAGHYPDSTIHSGRTVINGNIFCFTGGSIQGVALNGNIKIVNSLPFVFTVSKCKVNDIFYGAPFNDFLETKGTLIVKECIIQNILRVSLKCYNSIIYGLNNSICKFSEFENCIISNGPSYSLSNNTLKNCILNLKYNYTFIDNTYLNCHSDTQTASTSLPGTNIIEFNSTSDPEANTTFVGGAFPVIFSYHFDYRVKPSSAASKSGTDGTDKGIYGSFYPYDPTPYNPHIYFKDIAPKTNADGQLPISIKAQAK